MSYAFTFFVIWMYMIASTISCMQELHQIQIQKTLNCSLTLHARCVHLFKK